jgi:hypothetical protein
MEEALTRFVNDGVLEVDSNFIENSIRPSALGKKNFLFIGHPEAGKRSAVIHGCCPCFSTASAASISASVGAR